MNFFLLNANNVVMKQFDADDTKQAQVIAQAWVMDNLCKVTLCAALRVIAPVTPASITTLDDQESATASAVASVAVATKL